ncbi:MAG TPA: hypothetical protein VLF40_03115 [Candidatus Saccharimonadales bacterium]|nr:hypothetical protein [Candidatus Saccharimonadales bacterium]
MQNFIVLGIVPGTNVQTTFSFWLAVGGTLVALPVLRQLWRKRHVLVAYLRARKVAKLIGRLQLPA